MTIEFFDIALDSIGKPGATRDTMWACLRLKFRDTDTDHCPSIDLHLPVTKRPERTIAELENEVRDHAKTILREALALVEERDIESLRDLGENQAEAARARMMSDVAAAASVAGPR